MSENHVSKNTFIYSYFIVHETSQYLIIYNYFIFLTLYSIFCKYKLKPSREPPVFLVHIPANSNGTVSTFCVYYDHADQGRALALGFDPAGLVPVETRRVRLATPVCDFRRDCSLIQGSKKRKTQIAGVIIDC